jgi:hypothetical protein
VEFCEVIGTHLGRSFLTPAGWPGRVKMNRAGKIETVYVSLEQVRDLFVLQCNTGLRISEPEKKSTRISPGIKL